MACARMLEMHYFLQHGSMMPSIDGMMLGLALGRKLASFTCFQSTMSTVYDRVHASQPYIFS
eukprot:scaffold2206_cov316-Pavlova_lutheri.AAC.3